MNEVFFVSMEDGECLAFSTEGFTEEELKAVAKFGKVLSEKTGITVKVGTEDEFFE